MGTGFRAGLLFACCLLLQAQSARAGDPDVARFLLGKGEKALRAKKYEDAVGFLERALAEHSPLPEASFALGQALEKLKRIPEAIEHYEACRATAAEKGATGKAKSAARGATKALSKLRRRYSDLNELNDAFIKDCIRFARRYEKKDTDWARHAYETVLALDPGHAIAKKAVAKLPKIARTEPAKGPAKPDNRPPKEKRLGPVGNWTPLIASDTLDGWDPGRRGVWNCLDRIITGDVPPSEAGQINWIDEPLKNGDYSVRVQMRVVKVYGNHTYGIFLGGDGRNRWWSVVINGGAVALDRTQDDKRRFIEEKMLGRYEPDKWHTLSIKVKGNKLSIFYEGERILSYETEGERPFDGKVALLVSKAKVEFRNFEEGR